MKVWTLVLALFLSLTAFNADAARRLGGGKSVGQQSSNVTQRETARAPAAPTQNAAAAPTAAPATPAPVAPKRPWGAMLGGLAAGLGLAWLAHSLGMGEAFSSVLMFALLAFLVVAAVGWFMRRRRADQDAGGVGNLAYQGAGGRSMGSSYRPENVGNDASARPWERTNANFESALQRPGTAGGASIIGSALSGTQSWGIPADFDVAGFLGAAKTNFMSLQSAWDRADLVTLRAMMTDEMLTEIKGQLTERAPTPGQRTEIDMLKAELLGIEERGSDYMASVEFSGVSTEDPSSGPAPFREVWNMTKAKDGNSGWLVAGVQALQ